jgi:hypothetical protein
MQKLKEYFYELSLLGVIGRSFVVGPTFSDALIIVALVAAVVYKKDYLFKSKIDDKAELLAKIEAERASVKSEMDLLKNEIIALKIDKGFKNTMLKSPTMGGSIEQIRRF